MLLDTDCYVTISYCIGLYRAFYCVLLLNLQLNYCNNLLTLHYTVAQ